MQLVTVKLLILICDLDKLKTSFIIVLFAEALNEVVRESQIDI